VTPAFLRGLDEAKLFTPQRSPGGHRRYSRYQLRLAARARELVDQGTPLEAACRIIILEDQLAEALELNADRHLTPPVRPTLGSSASLTSTPHTAYASCGGASDCNQRHVLFRNGRDAERHVDARSEPTATWFSASSLLPVLVMQPSK
jgi:DNA-binding transcriptional MerR regulator